MKQGDCVMYHIPINMETSGIHKNIYLRYTFSFHLWEDWCLFVLCVLAPTVYAQ